MTRSTLLVAAMLCGASFLPASAQAATTFYRTDFTGVFSGDPPLTRVTGFFTLSRDSATQTGTLVDVDVTINRTRFTTANSGGVRLLGGPDVGPTVSRAGGIIGPDDTFRDLATGTDDFAVVIDEDDPSQSFLFYTMEGWAGLGTSFNFDGTFTFTTQQVADPTAAIPEPASWALMIGGMGWIGATMRRRRTISVAYA